MHDAKALRAKARERAAKGSRKVQKSVPATSLVVLHSSTVAHAYGFFLTGLFGLHVQAFLRRHVRARGGMWQVQPLSEQKCYQYFTIAHIISITVHQCPSNSFQGRCCRTDFRERRAKGARKERERRTWPGKVVGHSSFYEKPGLLFH